MKKILLIFSLLLGFSFSTYGQKLIKEEIIADDAVVRIYDTKIDIYSKTLGLVSIENNKFVIMSVNLSNPKQYIYFSYTKENNKELLTFSYEKGVLIQPEAYSLINLDNKKVEYYEFENFTLDGNVYLTKFNENHFKVLLLDNKALGLDKANDFGVYNISFLTSFLLSNYKSYIINFNTYNKFLK